MTCFNLQDIYLRNESCKSFLNKFGYKIYKITNLINGKCYIGDTKLNLFIRFFTFWTGTSHFSCYENKRINIHLYNSMRKYGLENFTLEVLPHSDTLTEEYYISKFDSFQNGYNRSMNGKGKWKTGISCRCKIYISKNDKIKRVKLSELEYWENQGWIKGRLNYHLKGRIRITKDSINKIVTKDELDGYLNSGWIKGMKISQSGLDNLRTAYKLRTEYQKSNRLFRFDSDLQRKFTMIGINKHRKSGTGWFSEESKSKSLETRKSLGINCYDSNHTKSMNIKSYLNKLNRGKEVIQELINLGIPVTKESYNKHKSIKFPHIKKHIRFENIT